CATLLWAGTAQATTLVAQHRCERAKLKAQGRVQNCLKKNAAGVIGGRVDAAADCQAKFAAALATADAIATAAGTSCRYLDNGDGTVSDLNTGLVWEKKDNLDSTTNFSDPHDADNLYSWSTSGTVPDGTVYTTFLAQLNNRSSTDGTATSGGFAGHCDWRLPTSAELQAILLAPYQCGTHPCIDPIFGPTFGGFWSSTSFDGFHAWLVSFFDGSVF